MNQFQSKKGPGSQKIELKGVKHSAVVMSGKGGVGKSTVSANLAASLAEETDKNVGLLDADLHGPNIPKLLGLDNSRVNQEDDKFKPVELDNLKIMSIAFTLPDKDSPVIWRGPIKMKAVRQFLQDVKWGNLDYLIIDLPPGTGDEPLSIAQLLEGLDGTIIVTTPQDLSLLDAKKAVNFSKKLDSPIIGLIENMSGFVCPHCGKETEIFKSGGGSEAAKELDVNFLGTIPLDPKIVQTGDEGELFTTSYPDSEASKSFNDIVDNIRGIVEKENESAD